MSQRTTAASHANDRGPRSTSHSSRRRHPPAAVLSRCSRSMSCQIHFRLALSFAVAVLVAADLFSTVAAQGEIIELTYELVEEQPLGTYVGNIVRDANLTSLYGADVVEAGRIRFRFIRPPSPVELVVDSITGDVRTGRDRIDRESICTPRSVLCTIRVDIAIHPIEYFRLVRLTVKIVDINDGSPRFPEGAVLTYDILESAAVGTAIKLPAAVDRDSPSYSVVGYRLVTPSDDANVRRKFKLIEDRSRDGVLHVRLVVAEPLDRESVDRYQLTVVATDGGTPPKTGSVDVVINVIDANDNIPLFDREEYDAIIAENAPAMTHVVRVRAVDRDVGPNGHVTYSFSESTTAMYGHLFAVNAQTGEVYITGSIDSDDGSSSFHLVIVARDSGPDAVDTSATINVEVRDVNDNAPMVTSIDSFIAPSSSSSSSSSSSGEPEADAVVLENSKAGTFIAQMTVVDPDLGNNGRFNCSLKSADGGGADRFLLRRMYDTEFQLVTTSPLDREVRDFYNVTVECTDFGSPPMTSHRLINIVVGDVNDNVPSFDRQRYVGELFENNYIGAVVVQTSAIDMDLGNNSRLIYSLSGPGSELFAIEPTSGLITAAASLDRESTPQVSFRVVAADSGNPSLVGSSLVFVTVLDVNDNRPQFVFPGSSSAYSFEVAENQPAGTVVGQISAGDRDSGPNQLIEYRLLVNTPGSNAGGGSLFLIDPVTGVLTTGQPLDREQVEKHVLTVVAVDRGTPSLSSTATAVVTVLDVNDNAPEFDFPSTTDAEGDTVDTVAVSTAVRPGTVVARLVAHDADTGVNSRIAYGSGSDAMSVPFRVDPDTGYLLVDGDLSQSDGKRYSLVVTASDYRGLATSTVLHVVVNASLAAVAPDHIDGDSASTASTSGLFVGSSMVSGVHLIAVVCLAVGSGTATVALIIAIAIIRRRRGCCCCSKGSGKRGRGARHYNCRTAACMRLSQTSTTSPVWNQTTASPTVNGKPVCQDKEVIEYVVVDATNRTATTFGNNLFGGSSNDTTGSGSLIGYGDRTGMAGANNASNCCCCCTVSGGSADCERCGSRQRLLQSCTALSGTNDQMNKVYPTSVRYPSATLRPAFKTRPIQSFNTVHQFPHQQPTVTTIGSHQPVATELEVRHLLRKLQTVPDNDDATSVHSNGNGSNTDSGRGASDDGDIAVTSSGVLKNNRPEISFLGDQCLLYATKLNANVAAEKRVTGRPPQVPTKFQQSQNFAPKMSNCAGVTDCLAGGRRVGSSSTSVPQAQHSVDVVIDDDDAATTTSGSYVVDARELCNEIDQMFFTGGV